MKKIFFICFLFLTKIALSQNYVLDFDTKKPIEALHISYNKSMGLITNEDGYFELPNNIDIDTLYFSHLSYKSKKLLLSSLKKNDTIFLNNSVINLDEVVLFKINPKGIVIKSINKINDNYLNISHNLHGFLRQSLQENKKGVEMVEVEFNSYVEQQVVSTKIINARRTKNHSKLGLETVGGVSALIEDSNFVGRKEHFLDYSKINDYEFIYEGQIEYDNFKVYKIIFSPIKDDNLQNIRKGVLYIDSKSYAIVEIRYTFQKDKLSEIAKQSEKNISFKKPFYRLKHVENVIKYKQLPNKKWGLFYLEIYNLREGIYKSESYDYGLTAKLVINNTKTLNTEEVKTNYKLTKNFNKAVRRFEDYKNWGDNYKFSLSNAEKKILEDIIQKDNTNKK